MKIRALVIPFSSLRPITASTIAVEDPIALAALIGGRCLAKLTLLRPAAMLYYNDDRETRRRPFNARARHILGPHSPDIGLSCIRGDVLVTGPIRIGYAPTDLPAQYVEEAIPRSRFRVEFLDQRTMHWKADPVDFADRETAFMYALCLGRSPAAIKKLRVVPVSMPKGEGYLPWSEDLDCVGSTWRNSHDPNPHR
jgi:hypothetical protein